jgi:hypothetical protein
MVSISYTLLLIDFEIIFLKTKKKNTMNKLFFINYIRKHNTSSKKKEFVN